MLNEIELQNRGSCATEEADNGVSVPEAQPASNSPVSAAQTKLFIPDALFHLNVVGANPENQTVFSRTRLVFFTTISLTLITLIVLEIVINWRGVESLLQGSDAAVALIELKIKLVVLLLWRKKVIDIVEQLQKFWPEEQVEEGVKDELRRVHAFVARFIRGLKICYWSTFALYGLKPMVSKHRELPLKFYQPFDLLVSPRYEIVCLLQMTNALVFTLFMMGFDFLFISVVMHTVCELKLIKHKLANLRMERNEEECLERLRSIVDHHNFILGFIRKVSDLFSMIMLSEFLVSTFCICLGMLSLSRQGFPPGLSVIIQYGLYLTSYSMELYIYCAGGNFLAVESEGIADAIYNSNWWIKYQPKLLQAIFMIIVRSQKGERLSVGDMFDLNVESFTSVMNMGMSFFALMRAFYVEQKTLDT